MKDLFTALYCCFQTLFYSLKRKKNILIISQEFSKWRLLSLIEFKFMLAAVWPPLYYSGTDIPPKVALVQLSSCKKRKNIASDQFFLVHILCQLSSDGILSAQRYITNFLGLYAAIKTIPKYRSLWCQYTDNGFANIVDDDDDDCFIGNWGEVS